jgi:4-azaleucine resistance transporter AzlC
MTPLAGGRKTAAGGVVFTAAGIRRGARRALPLVAGLLPFGLVAGVMSQAHGLSWLEGLLMAGLVFAGSGQVLALSTWSQDAPALTATVACLVVNLRMMLMGPSLAGWLDRLRGWRVWGSLFFMADHNWALSITDLRSGGQDAGFLLGSGLALWSMWVLGCVLGFSLGGLLQPAPGHPLFFVVLAVFIALLVTLWRGRPDALPWAVAAAVAVLVQRLLPGGTWYIVAGALSGSLAGMLRDRRVRA